MRTMSHADLMRIETWSPLARWILKSAWGSAKYLEKFSGKAGAIALWFSVWWLATKGITSTNAESLKEVWLDAADLWIGMVPFWWAYDVWMAIRGKDLNGRELSGTDRWIRGGLGVLTTALDVAWLFTLGTWNAASAGIKAVVKSSAILWKTVKTVDKVVDAGKTVEKVADGVNAVKKAWKAIETAEDLTKVGQKLLPVYKWLKVINQVAMFGVLGYWLYEGVKDTVVNLAMPTASAVATQVDVVTTKPVEI